MLAMQDGAPQGARPPALTLTTTASVLAPTAQTNHCAGRNNRQKKAAGGSGLEDNFHGKEPMKMSGETGAMRVNQLSFSASVLA